MIITRGTILELLDPFLPLFGADPLLGANIGRTETPTVTEKLLVRYDNICSAHYTRADKRQNVFF